MEFVGYGGLLLSGVFGALYFYERSLRKAANREVELAWQAASKNQKALEATMKKTEALRAELMASSRGLQERVEHALEKMEPSVAKVATRRIFDEWVRENNAKAPSPLDAIGPRAPAGKGVD